MPGGKSKTSGGSGSVGGTSANCAQEGDIAVIANQVADTTTPFKDGLDLKVAPTGASGKTDAKGLKVFTKLKTNTYKVTASLSGSAADKFELLSKPTTSVNVPAGGIATVNFDVAPFATLKVKVVLRRKTPDGKETETVLDGVKFDLVGKVTKNGTTTKDAAGVKFEKLSAGDFTVRVTSLGKHAETCQMPAPLKLTVPAGATQEAIVVIKAVALLRIIVWDKAGKPVSGLAWKLTAPIEAQGTLPANGMIEVKNLPLEPANGALRILFTAPKPVPIPPVPAPGPVPAIPPYPPDVKPDEFKEPAAKPKTPDNDPWSVEWVLKLDEVEKFDNDRGVQVRLHNLGFPAGSAADAARVTRSVKAYQKLHLKQDAGSGKLADIKSDLIKRHDQP